MHSSISRLIYRLVDLTRGQKTADVLRELQANENILRSELQELSWRKLIALVKFAYEEVPYYRSILKKVDLHPNDIRTPADFRRIPILTKEEFKRNIPRMAAINYKSNYSIAKTSGSTGMPLEFLKDNTSFCYSQAAMYRGHIWHGAQMGELEAMLWGIPVTMKKRLVVKSRDMLLNRFRERTYNLTGEVFEDFYHKCKRARPSYLMGYTSMVYQFAYYLREKKLDGQSLRFKMVKCTSETIHPHQRKLIEAVFSCQLVSEYGAAETGLIAFECERGNQHLMSDCCYAEILSRGRPADQGETGRIIVTDLHNYKMPVIRYDIGDTAVSTDEYCSCGRSLPIIRDLTGRSADIVMSTSGRPFHSIILYYIMKDYFEKKGGIKQFKVYQRSQIALEIILVRAEGFNEGDLSYLSYRIKEMLGADMNIIFTFRQVIERELSGKIRDFVSDLDTSEMQKTLY